MLCSGRHIPRQGPSPCSGQCPGPRRRPLGPGAGCGSEERLLRTKLLRMRTGFQPAADRTDSLASFPKMEYGKIFPLPTPCFLSLGKKEKKERKWAPLSQQRIRTHIENPQTQKETLEKTSSIVSDSGCCKYFTWPLLSALVWE